MTTCVDGLSCIHEYGVQLPMVVKSSEHLGSTEDTVPGSAAECRA